VMENKEAVLEKILSKLSAPSTFKPPSLTLPRKVAGEGIQTSPLPRSGVRLDVYVEGRGAIQTQEILAGLSLTGYFLAHWLLTPHNRKLPAARARLIQNLEKTKELHGTEV
jgi:hypothetical protein